MKNVVCEFSVIILGANWTVLLCNGDSDEEDYCATVNGDERRIIIHAICTNRDLATLNIMPPVFTTVCTAYAHESGVNNDNANLYWWKHHSAAISDTVTYILEKLSSLSTNDVFTEDGPQTSACPYQMESDNKPEEDINMSSKAVDRIAECVNSMRKLKSIINATYGLSSITPHKESGSSRPGDEEDLEREKCCKCSAHSDCLDADTEEYDDDGYPYRPNLCWMEYGYEDRGEFGDIVADTIGLDHVYDLFTYQSEPISYDGFVWIRYDDTYYIINLDTGIVVSWYKHVGRAVEMSKDLDAEDLRVFFARFKDATDQWIKDKNIKL